MKHIRSLILALALSAGLAPAFAQAPPPVPALPDTERRTSYVISASTCQCAVGFQLYQDSTDVANWLKVYLNGVEIPQPGNWNITSPSGAIATLPRPISNAILTFTTAQTGTVQIVGAQRPRRLSEYSENRGVAARDLNQTLNGIEAQLREMWDRQFRTVQAPPGETLSLLPALASRTNMGACFDGSGNLASCVSVPSGTFTAGTGIGFTGTNPTIISNTAPTYSAGQGISFTGSNPTVISVNQTTSVPVLQSRAASTLLDLSAYGVVKTAGYATAGDGGGATFQKVAGGTPFTDVYITTASITAAGSAYTNGTYQGVALGGGTGQGCAGRVTVAGGVVTLIEISATICPGYSVGDVLTPSNVNMGGTGSGATYTVSAISTAVGSFVDSVGTRFQIVTDAEAFPNVRQFGAKLDWNGVDATATNDRNAFLAGMSFTMYPKSSATALVNGGTLLVPKGAALLCGGPAGGFTLPGVPGLIVRGAGRWGGTQLVQCDSEFQNTHFIAICGIYTTRGQFGCAYEELTARSQAATTASNIAVFYSISGQQFPLLKNVGIIAKLKNCIFYDQGIGGAANAIFYNFECVQDGATANDGVYFGANLGGTLVTMRDAVFECSPTCLLNNAINVLGTPYAVFDAVHVEGHNVGYNVATTGGSVSIKNSSVSSLGGPACTAITLQGTNPNGIVLMENIQTGCAKTITNGHAGGADFTSPIIKQITCNPGAPCN